MATNWAAVMSSQAPEAPVVPQEAPEATYVPTDWGATMAPQETPVAPVEAPEPMPETSALREFLDRNRAKMSDTMSNVSGVDRQQSELLGQTPERQIGKVEAGVQLVGATLGSAGDAVATSISAATPDIVKEKGKEAIGAAFGELQKTDTGAKAIQYAIEGGKKWEAFAKANPQTAKTIGAAVEIGLIAIPALKGIPGPGKAIEKIADIRLGRLAKKRIRGVDDLMEPPHKIGMGDTNETITGRRTYTPTAFESERNATVAAVPKVNPKRSFARNQASVRDAARAERKALEARIQKGGNPQVEKERIMNELAIEVENIGKSEEMLGLRGNAQVEGYANDIMQKALDYVSNSDGSVIGLLQARRDLDRWVELKSMKAYDPQLSTARDVAQKIVRDKLNDEVAAAVPGSAVKASLKKQSHLLGAKDILIDKMKAEQETIIGRLMDKVSGATRAGTVGQITVAKSALAAIAGATGAALTGTGLTAGAAAGLGVWGLSKAARSKTAAQILRVVGKTISPADRLVLAEWVKGAGTTEEPQK